MVCELCSSATVLDPESATELLEMYQDLQMQPRLVQQEARETRNDFQFTRADTRSKVNEVAMSSERPYRLVREFCPDHPEEEVTYFCF